MWTKRRHARTFKFLRPRFRKLLKKKMGYSAKEYNLSHEKPYLIISNHVTTLDPFMVALSFDRPLYFVTSDHVLSRPLTGWLIKFLTNPIPKSKGIKDVAAIRTAKQVIKENGIVCIFPEGNRTYTSGLCHIDEGIAKYIKFLGCDLLIYNLKDVYGADPRWATSMRKGMCSGEVIKHLSSEEIETMSNEDLYNLVITSLNVSIDSADSFKSKTSAEHLERVLFKCPKCGSIGTLHSAGCHIKCNSCDFSATYTPNLTFISDYPQTPKNVLEWEKEQIEYTKSYDFKDINKLIYNDNFITLYKLNQNRKRYPVLSGEIEMYPDRFHFKGALDSKTIYIKDIISTCCVGKYNMYIYTSDETYELTGHFKRLNSLKYVHMYYHIKNAQEGKDDSFLGI